MKQLLEGNILHMVAIPNGIVAAVLENVDEDGKCTVEYRMVSLDSGNKQRVTNSIYNLSKFGATHKSIELQLENHLDCRACAMKNGETFIVEFGGICKYLDSDGYTKWKGDIVFDGEKPADVAFDGKFLWMCFSKHNTIVRYNPADMRQNLRIGNGATDDFASPCGFFFENGFLYVCTGDNKSVWRIDTDTYESAAMFEFVEPIYQYQHVLNYDIFCLKSGIYAVDHEDTSVQPE